MNKPFITMERMKHLLIMEESVQKYLDLLEKDTGEKIDKRDKEWLFNKGKEIFETYYLNCRLEISVLTDGDRMMLDKYLSEIQENISKMYAHILVNEFRLHLLTKDLLKK
jgi:hypothetical protein